MLCPWIKPNWKWSTRRWQEWTSAFQESAILGIGLGVQNEAGQRLTEFCQENALVIANTFFQQHKRRLYTWTSPHGQYRNQIDYIICSRRWRNSIQSVKARLEADCVLDHELFIAKFRFKLKKIGKTTRPFTYDLNKIPYHYTVEVTNRFKGFNMIPRVPEELWMEVCDTVQEVVIKTTYKKKKCKKSKMVVWRGLTNSCEKKRSQRQRRKGKIYPFESRVPKI